MFDPLTSNPIGSETIQVAIDAAARGGKIVQDYFRSGVAVESKSLEGASQGLVTKADLDSEAAIIATIRSTFPNHSILAEESNQADLSSEHLWIVDPLDGTNNFGHGIPHYAISVAYYQKGLPACGVVFDPNRNDWFLAEQGRGAWHNNKRVSVNRHQHLTETMIATGFYYDRGEMMRSTLRAIEQCFERQVQGIRRMGTASLDLVQVGLGRFGGYFEYTLAPWDFAAAALFVTEAGGTVTNCQGNQLGIGKSSVLATNTLLHKPMLDIVR